MTIRIAVAILAAVCSVSSLAATADFTRYQIILTRKPFGEPPPEPQPPSPPPAPPAPQAPPFTKDLRMCAITESDSGIRVGLLNLKDQTSCFLEITDDQTENDKTKDGIELVDANFIEEWALLRKDGMEETIFMNGDRNTQAATQPTALAMQPGSSTNSAASYRDKLRKRRESIRRMDVEPPKLTGAELQQHLRKYNLELIRAKGSMGPPLPIELTPEEDEALVKEGVLPPLEGKPLPPAD